MPFTGTLVEPGHKYVYKTYKEIEILSEKIGSGIQHLKLYSENSSFKDYHLKLVSVFSSNREEWVVLDICCSLYKYTLVPLYATLGIDNIEYILNHAEIKTIFSSKEGLDQMMSLK